MHELFATGWLADNNFIKMASCDKLLYAIQQEYDFKHYLREFNELLEIKCLQGIYLLKI